MFSLYFKKITIFFVIAFMLCCIFVFVFFSYGFKTNYSGIVEDELAKYDTSISVETVLSVMKIESNFDIGAKSRTGAIGLMQIMPATAEYIAGNMLNEGRKLDISNLCDVEVNVALGVWYLVYLEKKLGSIEYILAGYNAGENVALEWQKNGVKPSSFPYEETRNYVKKYNKTIEVFRFRTALNRIIIGF